MVRENSFSDGDSGRSLTPDLDEDPELRRTTSPRRIGSPSSHTSRSPLGTLHAISSPIERFRAGVQKVIQMNRMSSSYSASRMSGTSTPTLVGDEPGVDVRKRAAIRQYGHIREECTIEIMDYSALRASSNRMRNDEFVAWLADEQSSKREPWTKVRWIHIEGISFDVLSALALRYGGCFHVLSKQDTIRLNVYPELHPLALEDVLHQSPRSTLLSKADYYPQHLFLRVLCHTLTKDESDDLENDEILFSKKALNRSYERTLDDGIDGLPRSSSPEPEDGEETDVAHEESPLLAKKRPNGWSSSRQSTSADIENRRTASYIPNMSPFKFKLPTRAMTADQVARKQARKERLQHAKAVERLKAGHGHRVDVRVHPLCIFLTRGGTVLTITRSSEHDFAAPIRTRLQHRDTSLRLSADPALLVHAILDLAVDRVFEVIEAYHSTILALEHQILLRPQMSTVRALHTIQQDLAQHKRTLEPVKTVVYGLRRYDTDRAAALVSEEQRLAGVDSTQQGFMSQKAKIYLADVVDHMDYILTSVEMFAGTTENLINFSFNVRLSFLPCKALTNHADDHADGQL
jgi:Mg2+ and Co2+ transporter CorA